MNIFGLTGNIGCGKSTVAKILASYKNVISIDCDQLAKQCISAKDNWEHINTIAGECVVDTQGINRQRLAEIIFSNPTKKQAIESLIHPLVWNEVERICKAVDTPKVCLVESATLFESGWENRFTAVITVTCSKEEQMLRLEKNRGMSKEDITARVNAQLSQDYKCKRSLYTIDTLCTMEGLQERVRSLYEQLLNHKG
jgi:dephospho-CoA kinase